MIERVQLELELCSTPSTSPGDESPTDFPLLNCSLNLFITRGSHYGSHTRGTPARNPVLTGESKQIWTNSDMHG